MLYLVYLEYYSNLLVRFFKHMKEKIKAVISDVDGVMTDGGMYCTQDGVFFKKFHTRDVGAIRRLQANGIKVFVITASNDCITRTRIETMSPDWAFYGVEYNKFRIGQEICDEWGFDWCDIAYIGDDIIDTTIMRHAGVSIAPADALDSVKQVANIICPVSSGCGVLAWVADTIIENHKDHER
jgi:YrbI family 3-deoxy-D-manno-octulosonate 8-phosphate phosphatase